MIGTIGLMPYSTEIAVLKKFFVYEDYQGEPNHVGRRLYHVLLDFAREKGFKSILLDTPPYKDCDFFLLKLERKTFLTTKRINFSYWEADDLPLAKLLWGEPDVTKYICSSGKFSAEDISDRLKKEIDHNKQFDVQYWPIFERGSDELIGCCGLRPYRDHEYELGFHLRSKFWRQGYAAEAAAAVIEYAFTVLKARRLFAGHNPQNMAS